MNAVILQTAARVVMPVMLLLSLVALLRGHNEPGGGFVGGLLAATSFALYGLAFTVDDARRMLRVSPTTLIGAGLLFGLGSGIPGMVMGDPFLTSQNLWFSIPLPGENSQLKIGPPLIFDIGVYLVVTGITLLMIFTLEDARYGHVDDR